MTIEQKRKKLQTYCDMFDYCYDGCILHDGDCNWSVDDERCEEAYKMLTTHNQTDTPNSPNDIVNHPPHYCREGSMECIQEMELIFGKEAVKYFCLCNAWKYRYRSTAKNGEEDIKKSDWYIQKYKELSSNE